MTLVVMLLRTWLSGWGMNGKWKKHRQIMGTEDPFKRFGYKSRKDNRVIWSTMGFVEAFINFFECWKLDHD